MAKRKKAKSSRTPVLGFLNFSEGSYLETTSRPLYSLLFILPLVVVYEIGTQVINSEQIAGAPRIVSFTWLMELAERLGMNPSIAWSIPGLAVVIILLCWHLSSKHSWDVKISRLGGMVVESLVYCLPLFALGALINSSGGYAEAAGEVSKGGNSYFACIVTSIGAGVYEELMFRLILMGLLLMLFEDLFKMKDGWPIILAVLISAMLFSAHHYIGFRGGQLARLDEFSFLSYVFRTGAGIYFAILFYYRGYGITAGAHIAYDVIFFTFAR